MHWANMMAHRPLVAGNWKMNGLTASIGELDKIVAGARTLPQCRRHGVSAGDADRELCQGSAGHAGCDRRPGLPRRSPGPHTGDISAEMLRDAGAQAVIVGHSERRRDHGETDAKVRAKALAARRAGLNAIVCIGERAPSAMPARRVDVVGRQLDGSLPDDGADTRRRL